MPTKKKTTGRGTQRAAKPMSQVLDDIGEAAAGLFKELDANQVTITIPIQAVPLFRALCAISEQTPEQTARRAVLWWLQSEDALSRIDDEVNALLRTL